MTKNKLFQNIHKSSAEFNSKNYKNYTKYTFGKAYLSKFSIAEHSIFSEATDDIEVNVAV